MSDGRMMWRARDAGFFLREWIVQLGEEFGCVGPAVIDWLEDQAKLQNNGGRIKTGFRALSRGCFANDVVTVCHVVSRAVTLGLLIDYQERDGRFECVISWFEADQRRAQASVRKQRQRNGATADPDDTPPLSRSVTDGHGESRSVSESHVNSTEQLTSASQKKSNAELRSAMREIFAYWQEKCGHSQAQLSVERGRLIEARLRDRRRHHGGDLHAAILDARRAVDGAARAAFIGDTGKRHDGIELIFRNVSKLEDFMGRAALSEPAAQRVPLRAVRERDDYDAAVGLT